MPDISMFKSQRFRRLSREGFWILLGQAGAIIGALFGIRIITEMLSPTAYGELALGMTVATLANQLIFGPLGNGITRFYAPAAELGDFHGYLKASRRMALSATGINFLIMFFVIVGLVFVGQAKWITITLVALIFATFSGYNSVVSGIQGAARQRSVVALHQGMDSWVRLLLAVAFVLWLGASSTVVMFAYTIAIVIVLCSQYVFFRKIFAENMSGGDKELNWQKKIWEFSWPFVAWGAFTWAQIASDRWALQLFVTTQEVGFYAVLYQLGYYPISIATGMIVQLLTPILFQRAGNASDPQRNNNVTSLIWNLTAFCLILTVVSVGLTFVFHSEIFRIFVAQKYSSVSYLLPWMILAGGIFAAGQALSINTMCQMRTHNLVVVKITTAVLGILLNVTGAYLFGVSGVVYAAVLFSVVYSLWILYLFTRHVHFKVSKADYAYAERVIQA